mgnify:CR=1 FL=1
MSVVHSVVRSVLAYWYYVVRSLVESFSSPLFFARDWFLEAVNWGVIVGSFSLFSNSVNSSITGLLEVQQQVTSNPEAAAVANAALESFFIRLGILVIAVVVAWVFSYSFTRKFILSSLAKKHQGLGVQHFKFGKLLFLSVLWIIPWSIVGVFIYFIAAPLMPRFVQLAFPVLYLFTSCGVQSSFVKHQGVLRGLQGMFEPFANLHKLVIPYAFALFILVLLLSFVAPLIVKSFSITELVILGAVLISPWVVWWRRFYFALEREK